MTWWKKQFVLSAFTSVQNGDDIETVIAHFADAGLNALESNTPLEYTAEDPTPENLIRTLKACEKHNIRFFITDHTRMTGVANPQEKELKALVNEYSDFSALGGYYVWDEPHGDFDAIRTTFDVLKAEDPSRLPLVAMLPSYGPFKHPEAYPAFARKFVDEVDPPVLSFDYYAIKGDPGTYHQDQNVYRDLEVWSSLSRETGKPLWMYVTSCTWRNTPSLASLRLQVYGAIAYGVKGIQYFVAKSFTGRKPNFAGAPLNMDGSRSVFFTTFQHYNAEIKALGPHLMNLKLTKVMHTSPVPEGCAGFVPGYLGVMSAPDMLILSFHKGEDGVDYMIIVNKDPNVERQVALTVAPDMSLLHLPDRIEPPRDGDTINLTMPEGYGMLFAIRKKERETH